MKSLVVVAGVTVASFLTIAMLGTAGWSLPPIAAQQHGYRGTGMDQIQTKREAAADQAANQAPAPADPASPDGDKAGTTYQNVQVLKDLSTEQFNRVMTSITEWVAPEQGCTYCHNTENMASDDLYQKKVARRMLQMTQTINSEWKEKHVHEAGVTCFTCHRGQPVPKNIWFENPGPTAKGLTIARNNGQNMASAEVGLASLPYDTLTEFLGKKGLDDSAIRVNATTALPEGKGKSIQDAEKTYGLMMHMSESLGVNCTYCHNTRAMSQWPQSTPQRVYAWHGIRMVRALNGDFLEPLKGTFPENRLGPSGDVPKIGCGTCHNGQPKPLNGAHVIENYPELAKLAASTGGDAKPPPPPADAPK
jgi:photosynthetic reaction center cytochrome c subunit